MKLKEQPPDKQKTAALESLLRRNDLWRGDSKRFISQAAVDTGYPELNKALLHRGWPLGALVEVCQPLICGYSEWWLLIPTLRQLKPGYVVLINPPALPFAQGLMQMGIELDNLLVVQTRDKADFMKSFVELTRTQACRALLAWQPKQKLSYTDLRKCVLVSAAQQSLNVLFRPDNAQQQSSPASLRILTNLQPEGLNLSIFKQKGLLQKRALKIVLPAPQQWRIAHTISNKEQGRATTISLFDQ